MVRKFYTLLFNRAKKLEPAQSGVSSCAGDLYASITAINAMIFAISLGSILTLSSIFIDDSLFEVRSKWLLAG